MHMYRPKEPLEPCEEVFLDRVGDYEVIAAFNLVHEDCEEQFEQECIDHLGFVPNYSDWDDSADLITLQGLIDLIPEGIEPKSIKISLKRDSSGAYQSLLLISNKKLTKKDLKQSYQKEFEKFEKLQKQYEIDSVAYDAWQKDKEIEELEDKLSRLKKESKLPIV